jgi:hypothetical protein
MPSRGVLLPPSEVSGASVPGRLGGTKSGTRPHATPHAPNVPFLVPLHLLTLV